MDRLLWCLLLQVQGFPTRGLGFRLYGFIGLTGFIGFIGFLGFIGFIGFLGFIGFRVLL